MTWPTLTVDVDTVNAPYAAVPTFTDLVDFLLALVDTSRGRSSEVTSTEPGGTTLVFDNADGRFTPRNATLADGSANPLYPGWRSGRRLRMTATVSGTTYYICDGIIDKITVTFPGTDYSEATVTVIDGFDALARQQLRSAYAHEVLADDPIAYYPLDEPAGSGSAGDLSEHARQSAALVRTKTTGGTAEFGDDPLTVDDDAAITLTPTAGTPAGGYLLELPDGAEVTLTGGATIECWVNVPSGSSPRLVSQMPWQSTAANEVFTLNVSGSGALLVNVTDALGAAQAFVNAGDIDDGAAHHVAAVLGSDAQTLTVYVDGVVRGSDTAALALSNSQPTAPSERVWVGGRRKPADYEVDDGTVTIAHVALYDGPLTAARVEAHYEAGATGFADDDEATRIGRILDYAGWPAADRNIETGKSTLQAARLNGLTALQAIQSAAEWSSGVYFHDGRRRATFHNRHHRINAPVAVALNSSGALGIENDLVITEDVDGVRNDIRGTRTGGVTVRVVDQTSIDDDYGRRVDQFEADVASDNEITDNANYRLQRKKDARTRCDRVTVKPATSDTLWQHALGREIGDRVTIEDLPGTAPDEGLDVIIESVRHRAEFTDAGKDWNTTFDLSPADAETYWQLGDAANGALGTTTRLAY